MGPCSNVNYVEPNYGETVVVGDREFEMTHDLANYCVAFNIEVELISRNTVTSVNEGNKTYMLTVRNDNGEHRVGLLEGTKIYNRSRGGENNSPFTPHVNSLTTNYTDAYFTDVKPCGDTEMFGIKSVDITYQRFQIPQITVVFTDVRGMGMMQPAELRRSKSIDGVQGFDEESISASFFQSFLTQPYPRFTFYVKGFYGEPVAYDMMCSDFRASFNADSGSFDVTVKFIGYMYSFLGDVSLNALLCAPHAEPDGEAYWESQVANGRFTLPLKNAPYNRVRMPKLFEIRSIYNGLRDGLSGYGGKTTEQAEETTHNEEIQSLRTLVDKYQEWIGAVVSDAQGIKDSNMSLMSDDVDGKAYITIFSEKESESLHDILNPSQEFESLSSELNSLIDEANLGNSHVSTDLSDVKGQEFYDKTTPNVEKANGDSSGSVTLPQVTLKSGIGKLEDRLKNWDNLENFKAALTNSDKKYKAYTIEVDYSNVLAKIDSLESSAEANVVTEDDINKAIVDAYGWDPSIENFTKVVMAHFETLMHLVYKTVDKIGSNRTIKSLGVGAENLTDINVNDGEDTIVGPFPRVSEIETCQGGDDSYQKVSDTWLGNISSNGWAEVDLVEELLKGADYIISSIAEQNALEEQGGQSSENTKTLSDILACMSTPYDIFLRSNPYDGADTLTNRASLFGKLGVRAFAIIAASWRGKKTKEDDGFIDSVARCEAKNFVKVHPRMPKLLKDSLADDAKKDAVINGETIAAYLYLDKGNQEVKSYLESNKKMPWDWSSAKEATALLGGLWPHPFNTNGETPNNVILPSESFTYDSFISFVKGFENSKSMNGDTTSMITKTSDTPSYFTFKWFLDSANSGMDTCYYAIEPEHTKAEPLALANASIDGIDQSFIKRFDEFTLKQTSDGTNESTQRYMKTIAATNDYTCFHKKFDFPLKEATLYYTNYNGGASFSKGKTPMRVIHAKAAVDRYTMGQKLDNYADYFKSLGEREADFTSQYTLTRIYGSYVDANGNVKLDTDSSFVSISGDPKNSLKSDNNGKHTHAAKIASSNKKLIKGYELSKLFVMSIKAIDYSDEWLDNVFEGTASFLPRLAVLQIGALAHTIIQLSQTDNWEGISGITASHIRKVMPIEAYLYDYTYLPQTQSNARFDYVLNRLKECVKTGQIVILYRYAKYFIDWAVENESTIKSKFATLKGDGRNQWMALYKQKVSNQKTGEKSAVDVSTGKQYKYDTVEEVKENIVDTYTLNEDSEYVAQLTKNLMSPMLIVCGYSRNPRTVDKGVYINYFDKLIEHLKEEYGATVTDAETSVQEVSKSMSSNDDIRLSLYLYLKSLYDKWIPSTRLNDWNLESFFTDQTSINGYDEGHRFYFIDSYFAKIGHLPLNVGKVVQAIDRSFGANNYQSSLISFLTNVYSDHRCMFLCVQNFMDLSSKEKMENMFKPVAFQDAKMPRKYPDFIVVHTYEPDKRVAMDGCEFKSSTFLLNDEEFTPIPIKSRTSVPNAGYNIPAFGVSYGRQYQSYFKDVKVGMDNPVVTEQAIRAKFSIIDPRNNANNAKTGTVGQDLFDVYANTSYSCTISMMGCAWVQPMMYFVLLNIPMFKGSYLIHQVTHRLTQGDMTTEIVGVRMANVASPITKQIGFSEGGGSYSSKDVKRERNRVASTDNDCEYAVYPVENGNGPNFSNELSRKVSNSDCEGDVAKNILTKYTVGESLARIALGEAGGDELQRLLVITAMYCRRAKYNNYTKVFSQTQFNAVQNVDKHASDNVQKVLGYVRDIFSQSPSCIIEKYGYKKTDVGSNDLPRVKVGSHLQTRGELIKSSNIEVDTLRKIPFFIGYDTYSKTSSSHWSSKLPALLGQKTDGGEHGHVFIENEGGAYCWSYIEKSQTDLNKTLCSGFVQAIQSSANDSDASRCTLESSINGSTITITEKGKTKANSDGHLGNVFDIIFNTREYFSYVSSLGWIVDDISNDIALNNPKKLLVVIKKDTTTHSIYVANEADGRLNQSPSNLCDTLKRSMKKHYGDDPCNSKYKKECSILTSCDEGVYGSGVTIMSCDDVITANYTVNGGGTNMVVGNFDIGRAIAAIENGSIQVTPDPKNEPNKTVPIKGNTHSYKRCAEATVKIVNAGLTNGLRVDSADARHVNYAQGGFTLTTPNPLPVKNRRIVGYTPSVGDIVTYIPSDKNKAGHTCVNLGSYGWWSDFNQTARKGPNSDTPYYDVYQSGVYTAKIWRFKS